VIGFIGSYEHLDTHIWWIVSIARSIYLENGCEVDDLAIHMKKEAFEFYCFA
jgi:hypothetical protein